MREMIKIPYHNPEGDKACFDAWFATGSLNKARMKLAEDGVLNAFDRPFASSDSVRKAAVRHMIGHYEETKKMLSEQYKKNGYAVEDEFIDMFLIRMAVTTLLTRERVKFWLIENNLLEKYKKYIETLIAIE